MNFHILSAAPLLSVIFLGSGCVTTSTTRDDSAGKVDFVTEVKPLLQDRCVNCHNRQTLPNRTSFESRKLALAGDQAGPVLIPGKPNASRLLLAISAPDIHEQAMPPVSHRVTESEKALLAQWIQEGAQWPDGPEGRITPTQSVLE